MIFASIALLATTAQALNPITRRTLATAPAALALPAGATFVERRGSPEFIERELSLPTLRRTMTLTQAFGAARGAAKDAPDAGDRTGTYGWPIVLETTSRNLKANRASRASLQRLRWGYDDDLAKAQPGSWDLVVAAEVAYQRETLPAFLATVASLLKEDGRALVVMTPELADNGRGP